MSSNTRDLAGFLAWRNGPGHLSQEAFVRYCLPGGGALWDYQCIFPQLIVRLAIPDEVYEYNLPWSPEAYSLWLPAQ